MTACNFEEMIRKLPLVNDTTFWSDENFAFKKSHCSKIIVLAFLFVLRFLTAKTTRFFFFYIMY